MEKLDSTRGSTFIHRQNRWAKPPRTVGDAPGKDRGSTAGRRQTIVVRWDPCMMTSSNGNLFRVTGHLSGDFSDHRWFPSQRPVTRSFDVFFDLLLDKRLSKPSRRQWLETPSRSLWCHCNGAAVADMPKLLCTPDWICSTASALCIPLTSEQRI